MKIKELYGLLSYLMATYGVDLDVRVDGDGGPAIDLGGGFYLTGFEDGKPTTVVLQ